MRKRFRNIILYLVLMVGYFALLGAPSWVFALVGGLVVIATILWMLHETSKRTKLIRAWVTALRSRQFPQAQGRLYDGVGYCCLGVGCLLIQRGRFTQVQGSEVGEDLKGGFMPGTIRKAYGVTKDFEKRLVHLNDNKRLTFPEIAKVIEENLL